MTWVPLVKKNLVLTSIWGLAIGTLMLSPRSLVAGTDGTTSAEFLKVGTGGARAQAMGETQTGLANDVFAIRWNPAGLGSLRSAEVSLEHNKHFEGVSRQMVAGAIPTRSGVWGLAYNRLSVDAFSGYDAQGSFTEDITSSGEEMAVGWGNHLFSNPTGTNGLMGGVTLKLIREEHANVSKSGFAADLGVLYRPRYGKDWLRRMSLGLAVRQLGPGIKFDQDSAPLPTEVAVGWGYSHFLSGDILTAGLDLRQTAGEGSSISVGGEYWIRNLIALRTGYRTTDTEGAGFRAGTGFRLDRVQVDYAWTAQGKDLEASHLFTLTYRFGPPSLPPGAAGDVFQDHVQQGKRRMNDGLYDRALLHFRKALEIRPGDDEVMKLLLECGRKLDAQE